MTEQADQLRDRRRAFAAPGGPLDRIVRVLAVGLPAAVGVVTALMIVSPLSPRGEVSFLLDRNKVSIAEDRLRVDNAMYRGQDNKGRPFSLSAGTAVQRSASIPVVMMRNLNARISLPEGPAVLSADLGRYNFERDEVKVDGLVRFCAADGYSISARGVTVDLRDKTLFGSGEVEGAIPAGTFGANSILANLAERSVALQGNARLRMIPGQLRMPGGIR